MIVAGGPGSRRRDKMFKMMSAEWTPSFSASAQAASTAGRPSVSTAPRSSTVWRSPLHRLRLCRCHPRRLVAPRCRLRHRPQPRRPARRRRARAGGGAAATVARLRRSHRSRVAIRLGEASHAPRRPRPCRLHEPTRQPLR